MFQLWIAVPTIVTKRSHPSLLHLNVKQIQHLANTGNAADRLDPHVYETSCRAYRGLAVDGKHQSILVSGESGAGKTETVKIVMRHLSYVSGDDTKSSVVVQRVLDGQPLLEAFGNAKTVRNDNSSRFGKFLQMQFDVEDATQAAYSGRAIPNCVLAGSTCETYLLEKSRVVGHEDEERTYHIFYQLLAASDDLKKEYMPLLVGKTNEDFRYVGHTNTTMIEGMLDGDRFVKTLDALKVLDMNQASINTLFGAVSIVLQLGNVVFEEDPDDSEKCVVANRPELVTLAEWFGCSVEAMEQALTFRTVVAGKEQYKVPLKKQDARDGADAFSKEIYQQLFLWLVCEINRMTCAEKNYDDAADVEEYGLIGLLDIFGFESFEVNRFEQLCINYTNEKLQQRYNIDIFRSVQEEYSHEGIELGDITFADNAEVLRLIEGKIGIISVLNEECVRPKGNDTSFVSKVKSVNKESSCLISEKLHKPNEFAIEHYAGPVKYDATNFVQKNTDALPKDVIECACLSTNEIVKVEVKAAADAKNTDGHGKRSGGTLTVAAKFKAQLTRLMASVTQTQTRYIRCIKPNPEKQPLRMNMLSSAEQLRCAGVVAAVTISRVAFPNRLMHETALERFSCISDVTLDSLIQKRKEPTEEDLTGYKVVVAEVFEGLLKEMEVEKAGTVMKAFECGKSRIYFRLGALESLEAKRLVALGVFAVAIQRTIRGFTARSIFWKIRYATIISQANSRRVIARKKYTRMQSAAIAMECWVRCTFAKRELHRRKREKAATHIQSWWRTQAALAYLTKCKSASTTMQKIVRGALQRPKYRQALKEAAEEARVNSKLAALQKRLQEAEMKFFQADKMRIEAEKRAAGAPVASVDVPSLVSEDKSAPSSPGSAQQQTLIDESNEMLDYFRKEVFKLKSANYLLRTDLAALHEEHRILQAHSQSAVASYSAMTKDIERLSENNKRLARQLSEERDFIAKLKKDAKMDKLRLTSELNRKAEEVLGRDKMHDAEVARLNRELVRLREIIVETGGTVPEDSKPSLTKRVTEHKFERATFRKDPFEARLLRSLSIHQGIPTSLSRASIASADEDPGARSGVSSAVSSEDEGGWRHGHRQQRPRRTAPSHMDPKSINNNNASFPRPPPRPHTPLGAGRGRGSLGVGTSFKPGGRFRGSPSGTYSSPSYAPPGYNPSTVTRTEKVNTGTSLGAAAATAKPKSSLAAAVATTKPTTSPNASLSSLAGAAAGSGSSLSRMTNASTGKK